MPATVSPKTLQDQVTEIEKIVSDAQQQLTQARYALETLKERIDAVQVTPPPR
jgi:hypothetical protein